MTTSEDLSRMADSHVANQQKLIEQERRARAGGFQATYDTRIAHHPVNRMSSALPIHICADVGGPMLCGAKTGQWVLRSMASQTSVLKPTCPDCLREMGL